MSHKIKDEPRKLADVLRGMTECGAAPDDLWCVDQPDGDPFVARAAELLDEQEASIDMLVRMVDSLGSQLAALKASAPSTPPPEPSAQGEPVAWLRQDWSGSGPSSLSFDGPPDPKPVRDEVVNPIWTPLYASAPSTPPHAVMSQAADLLAESMMLADADRVRAGALVVEAHNLLAGTHAVVEAVPLTEAARDVLAERQRQIQAEGWTPAHDDEHPRGEMAEAAACYATAKRETPMPADWPWDAKWWKPKDYRSNLVRAGALILAELERLDRGIAPKAAQEKA